MKTVVSRMLCSSIVRGPYSVRAVEMTAKKPIIRRLLGVALLCLAVMSTAMARDLGTFGTVYDIVEKDALKELEEKAKAVDFSKAVDRNALVKRRGTSPRRT